MVSKTLVKIIGITATVVGIGASLISDWVGDKKIDSKIDEKVKEVLSNLNKKGS
jgi:hypothetical protein